MYFDGSGDYLTLPNIAGYDLSTSTPNWTIELWAYTFAASSSALLIQKDGASGTRNSQYAIQAVGSQWYGFISTASGTTNFQQIAGGSIYGATWYHLALVRNSGTLYFFVNGIQATPLAITITMANLTNVLTVGSNASNASPFNGYIANPRIIKGTALYTNSFVPPTSPLTAVTNTQLLLSGTNAAIYDNATRNVMETSTASISTSVVKYGTGSIAFVGTGYMKYPLVPFFGLGAGDFTVEFWMYVTSTPTTEYTIWESQTTGAFIVHKRGSSSGLSFAPYGGTERLIQADASIPLNTWQFIAISRVSGTTSAYVNSTRTLSVADTNNYVIAATANPYTMGARNGGTLFMPGYIDDFRITLGVGRYSGATITVPTAAFQNQ
jgi:hypothetical protein